MPPWGSELPTRKPGPPAPDSEQPSRDSGVPMWGSELPTRKPGLPARDPEQPSGDSGLSVWDSELPTRKPGPPASDSEQPSRDSGLSVWDSELPTRKPGPPASDPELPVRDPGLPARGSELPTRNPGPPARDPGLPTRSPGLPARDPGTPARDPGLPARGSALPTRTTRFRRAGRHRSPHQLSVPSDAPALILAVPGPTTDAAIDIAAGIIDAASQSCPGVTVRAGFLEGDEESLSAVLAGCHSVDGRPAAVVVPMLICPQPEADAAIAAEVAAADVPVLSTAALGIHPILAGALHARLAEAGLARGDRMGRISITSTAAEGVLVTALGTDAMSIAGTGAVLLAARLAVPVAAASLSDPSSVRDAAGRLFDAGVTSLALSPCVIGPETDHIDLDALAEAAGMKAAQPLGAAPALGQLAAMRYGAALQDPQMAGTSS
jgi:sirohydrochlorin ferrochelatase